MTKINYDKVLPVVELYTAVQSEGSRAGYPTIVVRTTGCTHRCYFGEGGWCDSWYTSIHPEKGRFTFNDIVRMYDENSHISEMMLTGGSPTMHLALVNELTVFANTYHRKITITIETEGSHYLETYYPIDLLSISPKFSNSIPKIGVHTPNGTVVDEKFIRQHNKFRLNVDAIANSIIYHQDFHIKPVIAKDLSNIEEIETWLFKLAQTLNTKGFRYQDSNETPVDLLKYFLKPRVWLMPAGDTREALLDSYGPVMNYCKDNGYKFSARPHIIAFDTEREV